MPTATSVKTFGPVEDRALEQLLRCAETAEKAVLCADHHVGYSQPIGGVVAYRDQISPSGVGYDIGCGNKAVMTDLMYSDIKDDIEDIMDDIVDKISFGVGLKNKYQIDHPVIDDIGDADFVPQRALKELASTQLGTVGAGNHYVDLFYDRHHRVWIGVHFGSRGFGHKTATGFLAMAQGGKFTDRAKDGEMDSPPVLFSTDSELGQAYISAMRLAGDYAYAGRDVVCDQVLWILGAKTLDEVHNHHNFAWEEDGLWVVRKGATPAFPGQRGFVGSSMGGWSVIIEGVDSDESREALYSTVHGAGRVMSRTQAAGKFKKETVLRSRPDGSTYEFKERRRIGGLVDWEATLEDLRAKGIVLRGGAADEAPAAYKDLEDVLGYHDGTIRVVETLRPLGVAMAGSDTYDPYKD